MSPTMELLKKAVSNDAAQIEAAIGRIADAWNRHDGMAYAEAFTADADFVNVLGAHFRGRQEIARQHVWLHATIMRNSILHILQYSIRFLTETVVAAHVKWEMEGHEPRRGWKVSEVRQGVLSLVFVREANDWKIATGHNTDHVTV